MFDLQQEKFEIEVYGYTIIKNVLTEDLASEIRDVLIHLDQQHGTDHRHLGTARHIANLPTYDPIFFQTMTEDLNNPHMADKSRKQTCK